MREDVSDEVEAFWDEISENKKALDELCAFGFALESGDSVNNVFLKEIWSKQQELKFSKAVCDDYLFRKKREQIYSLKGFCDYLENELKIEVDKYGTDQKCTDTNINLFFIDYVLGTAQDKRAEKTAISKAKNTAKEILKFFNDNGKKAPVIVLMSSRNIDGDSIAEFRKESDLLGGMFNFISKNDFNDKTKLSLKLHAFAVGLPNRFAIQNFVSALESSMPEVINTFLTDIKTLTLDDYSYIQHISLQEDGHPLGDYILWLYSAHLGHLLFENNEKLLKFRPEFNRVVIETLPLNQIAPSLQIASIYKNALFDFSVGPLTSHPAEATDNSEQAYLHIGDFFFKDIDSEVLMVINAQCDLAFAPKNKKRAFKPEHSIFFVPGNLIPFSDLKEISSRTKTELYEHDGKSFQIVWDIKKVIAIQYGQVRSWLTKKGFTRTARLRLPFALEIQRAFASDLTRVGMPVAPPLFRQNMVRVYYRDLSGKAKKLFDDKNVFSITLRGKPKEYKYIFNELFIDELRKRLCEVIKEIESTNTTEASATKKKGKLLQTLNDIKDNYNALKELWTPFFLPIQQKSALKKLGINICREQIKDAQEINEILIINIEDLKIPEDKTNA